MIVHFTDTHGDKCSMKMEGLKGMSRRGDVVTIHVDGLPAGFRVDRSVCDAAFDMEHIRKWNWNYVLTDAEGTEHILSHRSISAVRKMSSGLVMLAVVGRKPKFVTMDEAERAGIIRDFFEAPAPAGGLAEPAVLSEVPIPLAASEIPAEPAAAPASDESKKDMPAGIAKAAEAEEASAERALEEASRLNDPFAALHSKKLEAKGPPKKIEDTSVDDDPLADADGEDGGGEKYLSEEEV